MLKIVRYVNLKTVLDFVFAAMMTVILIPVFIAIALAIRIDSRGPILFCQMRLGLRGSTFRFYKFRTMIEDAEQKGTGIYTDSVDLRITRIGRFLRNTSLDELPQLINILSGKMSLIGPRPVPLTKLDKYNHADQRRLAVKPGITGWAQVNGRNLLTWPEKIKYDLHYIDNISLKLDVRIFFLTIRSILLRRGIYSGRYREQVVTKNTHENIFSNDKR